jgi:glycine hydroxymethyltransferase
MIEIADIINWTIENKDGDLTPARERVAAITKRF